MKTPRKQISENYIKTIFYKLSLTVNTITVEGDSVKKIFDRDWIRIEIER
jgi:hypothetical protein